MTKDEMVEEFICPGCVGGSDTKCGKYTPSESGPWGDCTEHVLGTITMHAGNFALGLPKGFNKPGWCSMSERPHNKMNIRVWPDETADHLFNDIWNHLNVPVWYLHDKEKDVLFVRTYCPRTNAAFVDIAETSDIPPPLTKAEMPLNVAKFYSMID